MQGRPLQESGLGSGSDVRRGVSVFRAVSGAYGERQRQAAQGSPADFANDLLDRANLRAVA